MIKYILWDIDSTLLDFVEAERAAMLSGFDRFEIMIDSPDAISHYNTINESYWRRLETGELTRDQVLNDRFKEFFDYYKIDWTDQLVYDFNHYYQTELGNHIFFNEGARETLDALSKDYKQYAVTNGSKTAQTGKLKNSGLDKVFDGVFISEDLGVDKPNKEFFDIVFEQIGSKDPSEYIIIGDSLTSDMRGGNNAGIRTIWYNPQGKKNDTDVVIDYCVHSLYHVVDIIEDLENGQ